MPSLQMAERRLYDDIVSIEAYARYSPGTQYAPVFLSLLDQPVGTTVLDAGCCTGKGGLALSAAGCDVTLCDLTDAGLDPAARTLPFVEACLWDDLTPLGQFDHVFCCDVLEHIPPQFTMLVVSRLLERARHGVFLAVSLVPDAFGVWAGRALHQTVQPFMWWKQSLGELGELVEARDLLTNALFLVRPRR